MLAGQQDTELPGYEAADEGAPLLATGTEIGHYRIDGPLGAGGMGVVYRATDTKLNRPAAIKVLPESLADPEARRRFQREAQTVSSLNHPHIVTVYDAGEYLERQYLITEFVDGGTLRQWAARPRGWRLDRRALGRRRRRRRCAHDAGILHRDIKPENILLAKNGYAKLADFGIAKLLEADPLADDPLAGIRPGAHSTLIGTAAYMSPEQAQGLPLDGRSDVYSFGLVLHELLSQERRPERPSLDTPAWQRARAAAPLGDDVPAELRTLVAKALEHEPADRYQTMRELVVDLRRVARRSGIETVLARRRRAPPRPPRQRRAAAQRSTVRSPTFVAVAALLLGGYALGRRTDGRAGAVLPFVNETGESRTTPHISEGLGDELRDRLMELPGLEVQARASSVSFRDEAVDRARSRAASASGVLVNGSVRRAATCSNVLVEVLDARRALRCGRRSGTQRSEREFQALQQEIAADVSALLVPEARGAVDAERADAHGASETANMLVLRGSYLRATKSEEELTVDEDEARGSDPALPQSHARRSELRRSTQPSRGRSALSPATSRKRRSATESDGSR